MPPPPHGQSADDDEGEYVINSRSRQAASLADPVPYVAPPVVIPKAEPWHNPFAENDPGIAKARQAALDRQERLLKFPMQALQASQLRAGMNDAAPDFRDPPGVVSQNGGGLLESLNGVFRDQRAVGRPDLKDGGMGDSTNPVFEQTLSHLNRDVWSKLSDVVIFYMRFDPNLYTGPQGLLPYLTTTQLNIEWDEFQYLPAMIDPVPELAPARVLGFTRTKNSRSFTRYALALRNTTDYMKSQEGQIMMGRQITHMAITIQEFNCWGVLYALNEANDVHKQMVQHMVAQYGENFGRMLLEDDLFRWNILACKDGIFKLNARINERLTTYGGSADTYVLGEDSAINIGLESASQLDASQVGLDMAISARTDSINQLKKWKLGDNVVVTRAFAVGKGKALHPLQSYSSIGEHNYMTHSLDGKQLLKASVGPCCNDDISNAASMEIYDENNDSWARISQAMAIMNCEAFYDVEDKFLTGTLTAGEPRQVKGLKTSAEEAFVDYKPAATELVPSGLLNESGKFFNTMGPMLVGACANNPVRAQFYADGIQLVLQRFSEQRAAELPWGIIIQELAALDLKKAPTFKKKYIYDYSKASSGPSSSIVSVPTAILRLQTTSNKIIEAAKSTNQETWENADASITALNTDFVGRFNKANGANTAADFGAFLKKYEQVNDDYVRKEFIDATASSAEAAKENYDALLAKNTGSRSIQTLLKKAHTINEAGVKKSPQETNLAAWTDLAKAIVADDTVKASTLPRIKAIVGTDTNSWNGASLIVNRLYNGAKEIVALRELYAKLKDNTKMNDILDLSVPVNDDLVQQAKVLITEQAQYTGESLVQDSVEEAIEEFKQEVIAPPAANTSLTQPARYEIVDGSPPPGGAWVAEEGPLQRLVDYIRKGAIPSLSDSRIGDDLYNGNADWNGAFPNSGTTHADKVEKYFDSRILPGLTNMSQFFMMLYANLNFNQDVLMKLDAAGVPLVVAFRTSRPHATYETECLFKMLRGLKTGATYVHEGIFSMAEDASIQEVGGMFSFKSKAVITNPKNVYGARNVRICGRVRGMGVIPIRLPRKGSADVYDPMVHRYGRGHITAGRNRGRMYDPSCPSMYYFMEPYQWVNQPGGAPTLLSLHGELCAAYSGANIPVKLTNMPPVYTPMTNFYRRVWEFDSKILPNLDPYQTNAKVLNHYIPMNSSTYRGYTRHWDPNTGEYGSENYLDLGMGHWGAYTKLGDQKYREGAPSKDRDVPRV